MLYRAFKVNSELLLLLCLLGKKASAPVGGNGSYYDASVGAMYLNCSCKSFTQEFSVTEDCLPELHVDHAKQEKVSGLLIIYLVVPLIKMFYETVNEDDICLPGHQSER